MISKLKGVIEPGKYYVWTVSAPNAGFIKKRVLHYINQQEIEEYINAINQEVSFVENDAGRYFIMAYLLELKHYLADALVYYQKAAAADPSITLYSDKLIRFRNEYWIR